MDIKRHKLIEQAYELSLAIERCGASEAQTNASIKASELSTAIARLIDGDDYVAWARWAGDLKHRRLQLCDSDAEGAFKVYRHSGQSQQAELERLRCALRELVSFCDLTSDNETEYERAVTRARAALNPPAAESGDGK